MGPSGLRSILAARNEERPSKALLSAGYGDPGESPEFTKMQEELADAYRACDYNKSGLVPYEMDDHADCRALHFKQEQLTNLEVKKVRLFDGWKDQNLVDESGQTFSWESGEEGFQSLIKCRMLMFRGIYKGWDVLEYLSNAVRQFLEPKTAIFEVEDGEAVAISDLASRRGWVDFLLGQVMFYQCFNLGALHLYSVDKTLGTFDDLSSHLQSYGFSLTDLDGTGKSLGALVDPDHVDSEKYGYAFAAEKGRLSLVVYFNLSRHRKQFFTLILEKDSDGSIKSILLAKFPDDYDNDAPAEVNLVDNVLTMSSDEMFMPAPGESGGVECRLEIELDWGSHEVRLHFKPPQTARASEEQVKFCNFDKEIQEPDHFDVLGFEAASKLRQALM